MLVDVSPAEDENIASPVFVVPFLPCQRVSKYYSPGFGWPTARVKVANILFR